MLDVCMSVDGINIWTVILIFIYNFELNQRYRWRIFRAEIKVILYVNELN